MSFFRGDEEGGGGGEEVEGEEEEMEGDEEMIMEEDEEAADDAWDEFAIHAKNVYQKSATKFTTNGRKLKGT